MREIPTFIVINEVMKKVRFAERESLKRYVKQVCNALSERGIIVPVNFTYYGERLYSENFDRDLYFLISCGIIIEEMIANNPHLYKIVDDGVRFSETPVELIEIMEAWK